MRGREYGLAQIAAYSGLATGQPRPPWHAKRASGTVFRSHEHFDDPSSPRTLLPGVFHPHGYRWAIGGMIHASDGTSMVIAGLRDCGIAGFADLAGGDEHYAHERTGMDTSEPTKRTRVRAYAPE